MMDIAEYIDLLANTYNLDEIKDIGARVAKAVDCNYFLYSGIEQIPVSSPQVTLIGNFPQEWMLHYQNQGYARIDPAVRYAAHHVTPLFWHDMEVANAEEADFIRTAADNGIVSGVTIPLHSGSGYSGILTLVSSREDEGIYEILRDNIAHLLLFGYQLHEMVIQHLNVLSQAKDWEPLSDPEKMCMLWAAEGKTAWEIGKILSIKERTVIFHLNRATIKLKATNRQHAIARAIALGKIRSSIVSLPDKLIF